MQNVHMQLLIIHLNAIFKHLKWPKRMLNNVQKHYISVVYTCKCKYPRTWGYNHATVRRRYLCIQQTPLYKSATKFELWLWLACFLWPNRKILKIKTSFMVWETESESFQMDNMEVLFNKINKKNSTKIYAVYYHLPRDKLYLWKTITFYCNLSKNGETLARHYFWNDCLFSCLVIINKKENL